MSDVPRATRLSVRWAMLLVFVGMGGSFWVGSMWGWVRGYREAEAVHTRGWNAVTSTAGSRAPDADLDRLLGRATATECYEQLSDRERPVPLLLALDRAQRETRCLTEAFKAGTEAFKARRDPEKLPGGQAPTFQRLAWTDWRPRWLGGPALTRADLLPPLQATFPRLDLVAEYPFAGDGAWVTLGGCLANQQEARATRKALYAVPGVAAVFDRTTRTPTHDPKVPRYVESACSGDWLHDGRQVARWLMTPQRAQDPKAERRVPLAKLIPNPDRRAQVLAALETGEDLEALGVHWLAMSLQEVHKVLYRPMWRGITAKERLDYAKMMFDVWARLPAPGTEE